MENKNMYYSVAQYEDAAKKVLPKHLADFLEDAANDGLTYRENELAFKRYQFRPKLMRGVSEVTLTTTLLGSKVDLPIGVSPFSCVANCHPDGEPGLAGACRDVNTCYIKSDYTSHSLEELIDCVPNGIKWMQFYLKKQRNLSADVLQRAEKSGYKAVVFTVDTPVLGRRLVNIGQKDKIMSKLIKRCGNYDNQLVYEAISKQGRARDPVTFILNQNEDCLTWDDLLWVKSQTHLPVVVKGIMSDSDAVEALRHGADAIMVSNHGGRQLDGVPATIDVLEEVVKAVDGRCEVYIDGGIRSGTDVVKALALGAKAVFVARPVAWGLTVDGQCGVRSVLRILKEELEIAMKLCGVSSVSSVDRNIVRARCNISNL